MVTASETAVSTKSGRKAVVAEYRRLRAKSSKLHSQILKSLVHNALEEGAKKLGMFRGGTLVFENEAEAAVLFDYCIYNVLRGGQSAVERFILENPPDEDSDDFALLSAKQDAYYSLFIVEEKIRDVGVGVTNLLADEKRILIVDQGISQSAAEGTVLATRLIPLERFHMTTGAALPLGVVGDEKGRQEFTEDMRASYCAAGTQERGIRDPAPLIRELLSGGTSENIQFSGESSASSPPKRPSAGKSRTRTPAAPQSPRLGRDGPCPCGSGKKYKNCCQKRR